MIRPRFPLAASSILAVIGLGALSGVAQGADFALGDLLLLAQSASVSRGPGFYLNLIKFVPVLLIYLL